MMSYLWILLLGSLLAASAQAQDGEVPTEEAAAPEAAEADPAAEVNEESAADKETDHTAEETPPTASEPENEAGEPEPPAVEEAEPVATPAADTEPEAEAEPEAKTETEAEPEAGTETEAEAATTTEAPAADPEGIDPKAEEPTALGDEDATSSTGVSPAQEESGSEATSVADPAVADNEEKTTVPAADAPPAVEEKVEPKVEVPAIKEDVVPDLNIGFDLEDALSDVNAVDSPGERSSSFESGPHVSGASGEDKPEAQAARSGSLAAILSAIAVTVVGAVVGYITYQKKKLCFKNRQEADPEAARKAVATEAQSDPQVLSNLLNSS
ncbi:brain acid soluble protein 1 isoform X2 [Cebidichthys violaceus]|uniref:brain acid soluble protein 1 isoform X2 n=1 Tax=Cebidichthys violaceus TaxID=271503 RepID=UPI0035CBFBD6